MIKARSLFLGSIIPILMLTCLGAAVRVAILPGISAWYDEGIALKVIREYPTFLTLLHDQVSKETGYTVYLHFTLLKLLNDWAGLDKLGMRLVTLALALPSIGLIYGLGRRMHGPGWGALVALWLALSPFALIHATSLRPHGILLTAGLACAYTLVRFHDSGQRRWLAANGAANVLLLYLSPISGLFTATQGLVLLVSVPIRAWWRLVGWGVAILVAISPIFWLIYARGDGLDPPVVASPFEWFSSLLFMDAYRLTEVLPRVGLDPNVAGWVLLVKPVFWPAVILYAGLIVLLLMRFAWSRPAAVESDTDFTWSRGFLFAWLLGPMAGLGLLSWLVTPCYQLRYVIYLLPAVYLGLAGGLRVMAHTGLRRALAATVTVVIALLCAMTLALPVTPDYRGAVSWIAGQHPGPLTINFFPNHDEASLCEAVRDVRPEAHVAAAGRLIDLLEEADRLAINGEDGWFVIATLPAALAEDHARVLGAFVDRRGIPGTLRRFIGRWDVFVYHSQPAMPIAAGSTAADAFEAGLPREPRFMVLWAFLAKWRTQLGDHTGAMHAWAALLSLAGPEADDEEFSVQLYRYGWDDYGDRPFLYEYLSEVIQGYLSASLQAGKQAEARRVVSPYIMRFPELANLLPGNG